MERPVHSNKLRAHPTRIRAWIAACITLLAGSPIMPAQAYIHGDELGWEQLGPESFASVNSHADTWVWHGKELHCSGIPLSVLRTNEEYRNFELVVEWMHLRRGGNSGLFVWTTPASVERLAANRLPGLPDGIEIQMLDNGFRDLYLARSEGRAADWFTTHGDVFAVRTKFEPFPPTSPNGKRSFPREQRSLDAMSWNHYYIRAINGEIRLWVNGREVSGGKGAEPAKGYICLESEGSPIRFRNIRLRRLP